MICSDKAALAGADHEDEVQLLNLRVAMKRLSWRNVIRSCMRRGMALLVCSIGRMRRKDGLQVTRRRRKVSPRRNRDVCIPDGMFKKVAGTPGLSVRTRRTREWVPIASRTRSRLKY